METLKNFVNWLKGKPTWVRIGLCVGLATLAFFASSCGTPKTVATVSNVNPNSTVTVTMSVSNSTTSSQDIDATPSLSISDKKID